MPSFGWLEEHLLLLGIAALFAGFLLGIICSAIVARRRKTVPQPRSRSIVRTTAAPPTVAPPHTTEPEGGDRNPRVQPLRGPTVHRARGGESIARIGPARRPRTPARRG